MSQSKLGLAIPTYNRFEMLSFVLEGMAPVCSARNIRVFVSDNASSDETAPWLQAFAKEHPWFSFVSQPHEVEIHRNVMAALQGSQSEFTWWTGDDDYIFADRLAELDDALRRETPDAILFDTQQVEAGFEFAPTESLHAELRALAPRDPLQLETRDDVIELFGERYYGPQLGSFILDTRAALATDYQRYYPSLHPHLGAFYDYLAARQEQRGRIELWTTPQPVGISLTRVGDRAKTWGDLRTRLARECMPAWIDALPALYEPHRAAAHRFHRHIFRDLLEPEGDDEAP